MVSTKKLEQIRAELHSATMLYWEQMKRFAGRKELRQEWHEQEMWDDTTLESLRHYRLLADERTTTEPDPDTGGEKTVEVSEPWRLAPRQALAVQDQLDKCAHKLGLDVSVDERRERYHISRDDSGVPEPHNDKVKKPQ